MPEGNLLESIYIAVAKAKMVVFFGMRIGQIGKPSQPGGSIFRIERSNEGLVASPGSRPMAGKDGISAGVSSPGPRSCVPAARATPLPIASANMQSVEIPAKSLLVLGGARSGKSRYAQRLAEASGLRPVLIATAEAHDAEMGERIARHAAFRGARWTLVEEPLTLAEALRRESRKDRIVVVDCATLWLSNLLLKNDDLAAATQDLAESVAGLAGPVIFVSNEAGCGIVPANALARAFRDAQGLLNQTLAEACEAVVLVSAGIALCLKPTPELDFRF